MTKNTAIMSKTVEILGEQAGYYLSHVCRTIDKKSLYLPGPDTVDRIWAESIIGKTKCDGIQNQMRLFGGRVSPKRKATKISHTHTKKHRSNGF